MLKTFAQRLAASHAGQTIRLPIRIATNIHAHLAMLGPAAWLLVVPLAALGFVLCVVLYVALWAFLHARLELERGAFWRDESRGTVRPLDELVVSAAQALRASFAGSGSEVTVYARLSAAATDITGIDGAGTPIEGPLASRIHRLFAPVLRAFAARAPRGFFQGSDFIRGNMISVDIRENEIVGRLHSGDMHYSICHRFVDDDEPGLWALAQIRPCVEISAHQRIALEQDFEQALTEISRAAELTQLGIPVESPLFKDSKLAGASFGAAPTLLDAVLAAARKKSAGERIS